MTTVPHLQIRASGVSHDQLAAYSALLGKVFGEAPKFTPQALAWRYRDNPDGAVVGFDLEEGRPKIVVNLKRAKAQNVDFKAELLKFARIVN